MHDFLIYAAEKEFSISVTHGVVLGVSREVQSHPWA